MYTPAGIEIGNGRRERPCAADPSVVDVAKVLDSLQIVRRRDEAAHGEFRTKRLMLEIYDDLLTATRTGAPYQTRLVPGPADPEVAHHA